MPRPLFDSEFLYGFHDPGGEDIMVDAGKPGWVLFTMEIGSNPDDGGGFDFRPWSDRNLGVIVRLNNGYHPNGTIPVSTRYADFARRCARFVESSPGAKIWVIGNEMNYAMERPQVPAGHPGFAVPGREAEPVPVPAPEPPELSDPHFHGDPSRFIPLYPAPAARRTGSGAAAAAAAGATAAVVDGAEVITPELYVRCYRLCRNAIRALPGHADDQVLVGGVAPWNNQTSYPGNANGDWVQYLRDILLGLGPSGCDGFAVHSYTHGTDPNLIDSDQKMNAPFQNRHYQFKAYQDFLNGVPPNMRGLPAYLTETDQDDPWADTNSGWVQRAYARINEWNQKAGNQKLRAVLLYRWPRLDRWFIEGKNGVIDDFRAALGPGYKWTTGVAPLPPTPTPVPPIPPPSVGGQWLPGATLATTARVNLRRSPGHINKPPGDVIAQVPPEARVTLLAGGPVSRNGLTWWPVRYQPAASAQIQGWMAEKGPDGTRYLVKVADAPPFQVGEVIRNVSAHNVNLRRTPGYRNKPASDVVAVVLPRADLTVLAGSAGADGLSWWQVRYPRPGGPVDGWIAQTGPTGEVFVASTAYVM
jgi:hypothetical protein